MMLIVINRSWALFSPFVKKTSVNAYLLRPNSDTPPDFVPQKKICTFAHVASCALVTTSKPQRPREEDTLFISVYYFELWDIPKMVELAPISVVA